MIDEIDEPCSIRLEKCEKPTASGLRSKIAWYNAETRSSISTLFLTLLIYSSRCARGRGLSFLDCPRRGPNLFYDEFDLIAAKGMMLAGRRVIIAVVIVGQVAHAISVRRQRRLEP